MRYLFIEKGVYYFRKVVPEKLQQAYGKKLIKRSLLTRDLKEAKLRLMRVSLEVHTELNALTANNDATHTALVLDAALIVKLSALHKRSLLLGDDLNRPLVRSIFGSANWLSPLTLEILGELKAEMAAGDFSRVGPKMDHLLTANKIELIAPTDALLLSLKQALLRTEIAYYTEAAKRDTGEHTPTSEIAPPVALGRSLSDEPSIMGIYDLWLKQETRTGKTAAAYKRTADAFNEWVKGIPAVAIKGEQVRDWVAALGKDFAHKTVANKHKHLIAIGEVGVRYDALISNPFKKAIVSDDIGLTTTPRRKYSIEEITKLIAHISTSPKVSTYDKWVMLLGYTTGARQRELCQIQHNDIEEIDGVWTIKITKDGKGQIIKNAASRRRIPLHPDLITAGFIKWLDSIKKGRPDTARIFPFKPDKYGNPAAAYSKRYGNMATKVLGDTSATCYHSFRHHYIGLLRMVPGYETYEQGKGRLADLLTGHSSGLVVDTYDKSFYPVAPLLAIVKQVGLEPIPILAK